MEVKDLLTLGAAILALVVSLLVAVRQLRLAKDANSLLVLVDLFREHRGDRLTQARNFVYNELAARDTTAGLDSLPVKERELVRDLAWYYDNLGALIAHDVVEVAPVSGYLGGSVMVMWERLEPLIQAERAKRQGFEDPQRWQAYFENLYLLVKRNGPSVARARSKNWVLTETR